MTDLQTLANAEDNISHPFLTSALQYGAEEMEHLVTMTSLRSQCQVHRLLLVLNATKHTQASWRTAGRTNTL